jgi:RNA polymerase sigma factor (sigma-70 family)
MSDESLGSTVRHIVRVLSAQNSGGLTDSQLLQRFVQDRDEAAFELLLWRHGPMVLRTSRRIAGQLADAEDAFQATFLVFCRKAASIGKGESVGSWLYKVAYRIARKAQMLAARRAPAQQQVERASATEPVDDLLWQDLRPILDEELNRLPEKYRAPVVLCYLEGKTKEQAARELAWPHGTVSGRLARAKEMLRSRLARRGITLTATLLSLFLAQKAGAVLLPAELAQNTLLASAGFGAGQVAATAIVSTRALSLANGVLRTMLITKLRMAVGVGILGAILVTGVGVSLLRAPAQNPVENHPPSAVAAPPLLETPPLFQDVTPQSGIDMTYHNGEEAGHFAILESLGGGVALLDYDGDGLLDVFITGGGYYDGPDKKQIKGYGCKLYKNLGNFKFKDVTKEAGLDQPLFYTHGAAVADYDCDGWPDLLVTGWGRTVLYHNEPNGKGGRRFVDVTYPAGLLEAGWTTSAAWGDLDSDGYPDLYICQYVDWSMENNPICNGYSAKVERDVCPPKTFKGRPHKLYRNNRNGTFTDVSRSAKLRPWTGDGGKDSEPGKGLGVVMVDVNEDGKPDIYVANDTVDKFLYINKSTPGKILFEEVGLASGVARDDRGVPDGSMGIDAGDPFGDGRPALWCTNYENEMHGLYRNQGNGVFLFNTQASGIAAIGQLYVGFGTGFFDFDNDGWEDLVIANGHVIRFPTGAGLRQRAILFHNSGKRRFVDIGKQAGEYFRGEHIGRGVALGDLDNDGDIDLVISHLNEPVTVLRNQAGAGNHWLGIELQGKAHHDIVGARVIVEAGGRKQTRFAKGGGSYLSSSDRRLVFGLGKTERIDSVTVIWPSGKQQHWKGTELRVDRYWRIIEGQSQPHNRN